MPPQATHLPSPRRAELYIGLGVLTLIAATWLPVAPFVTAVATICLGTTEITVLRFRNKPGLMPVLLLHAVTYTGLYALFVGTALHSLAATHTVSLSRFALLDLIVSVFPMTFALKRISSVLWQSPLSRH